MSGEVKIASVAGRRSSAALAAASAALFLPAAAVRAQNGVTQPLGGGSPAPAGTAAVLTASPASPSGVEVPVDYRLDTDDTVNIDVARHSDVSRVVRIPVDGLIRLPRLDSAIQARGKTIPELSDEILKLLNTEGKLVVRPSQLSVSLAATRVRRIFLRGNAGKNGDYDLKNGWRLTELIAVTGGVSQPERLTAQILNPRRPQPISLDLARAMRNPSSADNVALLEGDTVVITVPQSKRLIVKGEGPRGQHEVDERYGLRQVLNALGFTMNGASGDLRRSWLSRHEKPGDPNSPTTKIPVDIHALLSDESTPDVPLQDLDELQIPVSMDFIYVFGRTSVPKKFYLPIDRKTYLVDLMALGDTAPSAKIGSIAVLRKNETGQINRKEYDFGKFLSSGNEKFNPEIKPGDLVFVPDVKRVDPIGTVWQAWGLYGIAQALMPGLRIR